jgi:uncharacterized protein YoxC
MDITTRFNELESEREILSTELQVLYSKRNELNSELMTLLTDLKTKQERFGKVNGILSEVGQVDEVKTMVEARVTKVTEVAEEIK